MNHSKLVKTLAKPGQDVLNTITVDEMELLHMAVGVAGEAGELLDAVKKHVFYNKELDVPNVIEELGDLEFYMEGIRQNLHIPRALTIQHNILKLNVRYAEGYSDKAAHERADKNKGEI